MITFFKRPKNAPSLADQLASKLVNPPRKNILFVDDDVPLQNLMLEMEKRLNVDVTNATNAASAKTMIQARSFDLAILDVGIVNGDGLALYAWIQHNFPRMSVIFLTGGSLDEICPKVHAIGSAPVYAKPTANTLDFLADMLRYIGARPKTFV